MHIPATHSTKVTRGRPTSICRGLLTRIATTTTVITITVINNPPGAASRCQPSALALSNPPGKVTTLMLSTCRREWPPEQRRIQATSISQSRGARQLNTLLAPRPCSVRHGGLVDRGQMPAQSLCVALRALPEIADSPHLMTGFLQPSRGSFSASLSRSAGESWVVPFIELSLPAAPCWPSRLLLGGESTNGDSVSEHHSKKFPQAAARRWLLQLRQSASVLRRARI